jgi:hypothetical protein
MEQVGEVAGALAMGFTLMVSTIAWIFAIALAVTAIGAALSSDYPRIGLAPGRRVQKFAWNTWGTVERRNDYERADGSMIEGYDVRWDAVGDDPPDAQDSFWRCHMRPEPLLTFLVMRAIGQRNSTL